MPDVDEMKSTVNVSGTDDAVDIDGPREAERRVVERLYQKKGF